VIAPPGRLSEVVISLTQEWRPVPATLFLGFALQVVADVPGPLAQESVGMVLRAVSETISFRALLFVDRLKSGVRASVLNMSDGQVYQLRVVQGNAQWLRPRSRDSAILRQMWESGSWGATQPTGNEGSSR
jgi:hypothetical protein